MKIKVDTKKDLEIVERVAGITEELTDIVQASQGKRTLKSSVSIDKVSKSLKDKFGDNVPSDICGVFKALVVRGLERGRFTFSAYTSGKEIGLGARARKIGDMVALAQAKGVTIDRFLKVTENDIVINVSNDITCSGIGKMSKPICYFEAGLLSGILEVIFRKKMNLIETKCMAMGDSHCQFELYKAGLNKLAPSSMPLLPADVYSQENVKLLATLASHAMSAIENALTFEETRRRVILDGLTEIYNHKYFRQRLIAEMKRCERHKQVLSLIMLDIDNFKRHNDFYGHMAGDDILKKVARLTVNSIREIDVPCRYGGDEFVIILPQTDAKGALSVANRLRSRVRESYTGSEGGLRKAVLSISQGITTYDCSSKKYKPRHPNSIINKADRALLRCKKKGRGCIDFLPS